MDDALIVLAFASGALQPTHRPAWNPRDPIETWLAIGHANPWISAASDPPFGRASFEEVRSVDYLRARLSACSWNIGKAFFLGDLCLIEQTDGGDEFLTIRKNHALDSVSWQRVIATGRFEERIAEYMREPPTGPG